MNKKTTQPKRIFLLSLVILLMHFCGEAQPFVDVFSTQYQKYSDVGFPDKKGKLGSDEWDFNLQVPLILKNKDVLVLGSNFNKVNLSYSETTFSKNLYSNSFVAGYEHRWKDTSFKTFVAIIPKMSADAFCWNRNNFQLGGAVLNTYTQNKNLSFKLGLYYNREFFGNFFLPLIGADWRVTPKLWVYGVLFNGVSAEYKLSKSWYIGCNTSNNYQSYRENNTKKYIINAKFKSGNTQIKGFVNYYLTKHLMFYTEAGYIAKRRYVEYKADKTESNHPFLRKSNNGVFMNLGLAYRYRLD
jgi:hypothetical protein